MHFSIPDTQLFNVNGSSYMGYNIHINGAFHCTLRFRQLHCLHEQLRKEYPNRLPSFPPKKLLPLSPSQLEDRRSQLERYLQLVGQDATVSKGELLNNFLLTAQHESGSEESHNITLDIYLPHGLRRSLNITSTAPAPAVLTQICRELGLSEEFVPHFALYLARTLKDGELELVRRLQAFEAPHLSLRLCSIECGIYLRRAHWDPVLDNKILTSSVAQGLLYVQAVGDIERGWLPCKDKSTRCKLDELQAGGFTKEYLDLARALPHYGNVRFLPCPCDYPNPGCICTMSLGPRAIILTVNTGGTSDRIVESAMFPVTRVRCWRLTTVHGNGTDDDLSASSSGGDSTPGCDSSTSTSTNSNTTQSQSITTRLEFAFEYLVSRDNLRWITLSSEQAALMSASLQSIVDELVVKRQGPLTTKSNSLKSIDENRANETEWCYLSRDGGFVRFSDRHGAANGGATNKCKKSDRCKKMSLTDSVIFNTGQDSVQNEAFEDIGDDDL